MKMKFAKNNEPSVRLSHRSEIFILDKFKWFGSKHYSFVDKKNMQEEKNEKNSTILWQQIIAYLASVDHSICQGHLDYTQWWGRTRWGHWINRQQKSKTFRPKMSSKENVSNLENKNKVEWQRIWRITELKKRSKSKSEDNWINFNSLHHPFVWRKKCRLRKKRIEKFGKWLFLPKSALTDFRGTADMLPVTEQLLLVKGKSKTCRNRHIINAEIVDKM